MTVILSPAHIFVRPAAISSKGNYLLFSPILVGPYAFRGTGFIAGTVKIKGLSFNTPLICTVRLVRERDELCVATTLSNGSTGAYRFERIAMQDRYSVIAYNREHNYRAVIADDISPEAM